MFIPHLILPNAVVVTSTNGSPISIDNKHPNYDTVVTMLTTSTVLSYDDLMDLMQPVREYRKALATSAFYENDMGNICIDISGYPFVLPSTLQHEVLRINRANGNLNPLQAFVTRLASNPDKDVHNQLYGFITACGLTLTEDGHFLAYKKVRDDYLDIFTGTMNNSPGQTLEMPRFAVEKNPNRTCSAGLHFAAWGYLQHYGASNGTRIVILKIDPSDVISIPSDYNNMKGRACKYKVLKEIDVPEELKSTPIWSDDEDFSDEDFDDGYDDYNDYNDDDDDSSFDDDEELSYQDQLSTARAEAKEDLLQLMTDAEAEELLDLVESMAYATSIVIRK